jgi:hypothetical protein
MKDELLQFESNGISFVFLEQSLHRTPQKMSPIIQEEIDKAQEQDWDYVILSYGLCSNGIVGIKVKRQPIVIPRVLAVLPCFRFIRGIWKNRVRTRTYYLTKGWIDEENLLLEPCTNIPSATGRNGEWVIREELKNYTRIALVDVGLQLTESTRNMRGKMPGFSI